MSEKIAILTDSGCDVPANIREQYGIYQASLTVNFKDICVKDDALDPAELYRRIDAETPTTSLPTREEIQGLFEQIKADGYDKVLAVTLSSGLSGTYNQVRLTAEDFQGLEIAIVDTLNVSVGGGLLVVRAAQYCQEGMGFEELKQRIEAEKSNSKVFFHLKTLEYLKRGGRIGHVAALLGNALSLRPIISCDPEGIYYTVAKVPGRKLGLRKLCDCAEKFAGEAQVHLALMHGGATEELEQIKERMLSALPQAKVVVEGQINSSLAVHTGPGLLGIGVMRI